jgi:hypothetical protein
MDCELWYSGSGAHFYPELNDFAPQAVGGFLMTWVAGTPLPAVVQVSPPNSAGYAPYTIAGNNFTGTQFYSLPTVYLVNCGLNPNQPCDCINGGCVPATTYSTPGVFANLAACQSGCAQNSPCTGECVDPAEIAGLRQALNNLQSKFCR